MNKVYQIVTDKILESLSKGNIPWVRPWKDGAPMGAPFNAISKKPYRGINALLLAWAPGGPGFMTLKQANKLGGRINKGSHGEIVTYWKMLKKVDPKTGEESTTPLLRYYTVFGIDFITGLPEKYYQMGKVKPSGEGPTPIEEAERVIEETGAKIVFGGNHACYIPPLDTIKLPHKADFTSIEGYYGTAFHELGHWTGHKDRLNRELKGMGSESYAPEELIAEITSACVFAALGLDYTKTIENHQAYCQHWAEGIRGDKANVVTSCASKAHKAADFILKVQQEDTTIEANEETDIVTA